MTSNIIRQFVCSHNYETRAFFPDQEKVIEVCQKCGKERKRAAPDDDF
jgi:hypothetical protein